MAIMAAAKKRKLKQNDTKGDYNNPASVRLLFGKSPTLPVLELKLTPKEAQVLRMMNDELKTPEQIQLGLNISKWAYYFHVKNIKNKGFLGYGLKARCTPLSSVRTPLSSDASGPAVTPHPIRLHGQEYNIKILNKGPDYDVLRKKSNLLTLEGATVRLYGDSLEVYVEKSFFGPDIDVTTKDSLVYFQRLLSKLENDYKVCLVKDRAQNIRMVKAHYAETQNEISKDYEVRGEKFKIYAADGKLAILIDNSLNLHELEFIHPETSKEDAAQVLDFVKDLRLHPPMLMSEVIQFFRISSEQTADISTSQVAMMEQVKLLLSIFAPNKHPPQTPNKKCEVDYIG